MSAKLQEPTEYKALPALGLKITDEDKGIVEHLISVFGVLDLGGDVCHPGSFTKTLQERMERIRVLDAHNRDSVMSAIGVPLQLKEVSREELPAHVLTKWPEATGGLWAETQFLLDTPEGKGAFARIKAGAVKEFSFGFNTLDEDFTRDPEGYEVRNLRTIRLWEYGPVLFGMNPAAQVLGAKDSASAPVSKGDEAKPAPDVTENTIRIRVKDPGGCQEGSFRVIPIDKSGGIQATICRPEGKDTTEVQSYIFDKSKWDAERARKWVSEHKKAFVILVLEEKEEEAEPGGPDKCVCPKCGHKEDKKKGVPCRSVTCSKCGTKLVADTGKDEGKQLLQLIEIEQAQLELGTIEAGPQ